MTGASRVPVGLRRAWIIAAVALVAVMFASPRPALASPHVIIHGIPDGVSTSDVTFWIEVAEFDTTCEGIYHILGPGGNDVVLDGMSVAMGSPVTVSTEGTTVVTYWVDWTEACCTGASHARSTAVIRINKTPPGVDDVPPVTYVDARPSYVGTATVGLTGADRGLGPAATYYSLDSGPQITYSGPFSVAEVGTHNLEYWTVDLAGNIEAHRQTQFDVLALAAPDVTPPVTSGDLLSSYLGTATIGLDAIDNVGGSGVASIHYRLDSAVDDISQPYTGQPAVVTVTALGPHTIEFWSEDWASNAEAHHNASFTIDTPPAGSTDITAPRTVSDVQWFYEGQASITLNASDPGSGVAATWYRLDGGTQVRYSSIPIAVTTLGSHQLEFWSVDVAGNTEAHNNESFTIGATPVGDITPPSTESDVLSKYTISASIHLTASDSGGSGVAHTYYRLDDGAQQTGTSISVSTLGAHRVEFWSVDVAGNIEDPRHTASFSVISPDTTRPHTTSDAVSTYTGSASIHLTGADNAGGSGVAGTFYRLDGGSQQIGTFVSVSALGAHILEFWSADSAGNVEDPPKTALFTVNPLAGADATPPSTSSDAVRTYAGSASIILMAGDTGGTGVADTYYRIDGGSRQTGTLVSVSVMGAHCIEFWSVDISGNVEKAHAAMFTVNPLVVADTTPPSTSSDATASYVAVATIDLTRTDNAGGSGVAHTYYSLDGGAQTDGATLAVTGAGSHSLAFWSVDWAGNAETPHHVVDFTITNPAEPDTTAPSTSSDAAASYVGAAAIHLAAVDNAGGWGVAHTYHALDGAAQAEGAFVAVGAGSHTLEFWSVDAAGNVETTHTRVDFTVSAPPTPTPASHPAPALSDPVAPRTMSRTRSYVVYVTLKPRHAAGTRPVRIYRYRLVSRVWKSYGYVSATAANYSTFTKCSARVRLATKGKWRLRAYAPADSRHAAKWSTGFDYVTVR